MPLTRRGVVSLALGAVADAVPAAARGQATPTVVASPAAAAEPTLAARFFDATFNATAPAADLLTPDFVFHLATDRYAGPGAFHAFVGAFWAAFSDLHVAVQTAFTQGDRIAARFAFRGTQVGPFQGIPATHRAVLGIAGQAILRVWNGRLTEVWTLVDEVSLLQQLGAMSGSASPADPGPPSPAAGTPPDLDSIPTVQAYFTAWNAGDVTALNRVVAPDWVGHPKGPARHPAATATIRTMPPGGAPSRMLTARSRIWWQPGASWPFACITPAPSAAHSVANPGPVGQPGSR